MHKNYHFDKRNTKKIFAEGHNPSPVPHALGAFDARPPVPLSDGLDTRPCKILDLPLLQYIGRQNSLFDLTFRWANSLSET